MYIRFMGTDEIERYLNGETLVNTKNWRGIGKGTDSVGFCFFDDTVSPEDRIEYLTGVTSMDMVAVFEAAESTRFKESYGKYRDPEKESGSSLLDILFCPPPLMEVKEYSITEYNQGTMRLVKLGIPEIKFDGHSIDWIYKKEDDGEVQRHAE